MEAYWQIEINCPAPFTDILIAELATAGFDSFVENDHGFTTYSREHPDQTALQHILTKYTGQTDISHKISRLENRNWNAEWEKSYRPVVVDERCIVRASFHPPAPEYPIEIIINPRMSFGTGHHATTWLMLHTQLTIDHRHKRVLDAGCGTGILSVMAGKLGAEEIIGFDIDKAVVDNARENLKINEVSAEIQAGTLDTLNIAGPFDIILANINKNVLLHDLPGYARLLADDGHLVLSGFYNDDLADLQAEANRHGLRLQHSQCKDDWAVAVFRPASNER